MAKKDDSGRILAYCCQIEDVSEGQIPSLHKMMIYN